MQLGRLHRAGDNPAPDGSLQLPLSWPSIAPAPPGAPSPGPLPPAVWAAQQPLDKAVFGSRYDDTELLGKAVTRGPSWMPVGVAMHVANGAAVRRRVREPGSARAAAALGARPSRRAGRERRGCGRWAGCPIASTRRATSWRRSPAIAARSRRRPGAICCSGWSSASWSAGSTVPRRTAAALRGARVPQRPWTDRACRGRRDRGRGRRLLRVLSARVLITGARRVRRAATSRRHAWPRATTSSPCRGPPASPRPPARAPSPWTFSTPRRPVTPSRKPNPRSSTTWPRWPRSRAPGSARERRWPRTRWPR